MTNIRKWKNIPKAVGTPLSLTVCKPTRLVNLSVILNIKGMTKTRKTIPIIIEITHLSKLVTLPPKCFSSDFLSSMKIEGSFSSSLEFESDIGKIFLFLDLAFYFYPIKMCDDFCEKTFWLKNPTCLFDDLTVIPTENMTLAEKMNAITRLVILVFIIMLIFEYKYSVHFLLIALILIIIYYYMKKKEIKRRKQKSSFERYYTMNGKSDDSGEEGVGEEVELSPEGLEYLKAKSNKPNPRRPYPSHIPSDIEVKASREESFDSYTTFNGKSKHSWVSPVEEEVKFEPQQVAAAPPRKRFAAKNGNNKSQYVERAEHKISKPLKPRASGSDLYFRRAKQLETMFKSKIDAQRQSAINSII